MSRRWIDAYTTTGRYTSGRRVWVWPRAGRWWAHVEIGRWCLHVGRWPDDVYRFPWQS